MHSALNACRRVLLPSCVTAVFMAVTGGSFVFALPPPLQGTAVRTPLSTYVIEPTRIVWSSEKGVRNAERLLKANSGQAVLKETGPVLKLAPGAGLLLDFGIEIHGSVNIITPIGPNKNPPMLRVRLGESVAESMAELGERGAQNDHALRDQTILLPWLGKTTIGPSGFRFIRIDNLEKDRDIEISQLHAQLVIRDIPYVGSFECSDPRLNQIWKTGAYTVHLNMQEYLWDGVKRDRLVWLGDMHPEVSVINAVFGYNDVVPRSLDLIRDATPVDTWMNGISSYSMWWVVIHEDWYLHHGNLDYLREQQKYLTALLRRLTTFVDDDGKEKLDGNRFLDWPTSTSKLAVHEGLQAMLFMTLSSGRRLAEVLGDDELSKLCKLTCDQLKLHEPEPSGRKSPAALLALAGLRDSKEVAEWILKVDGPKDLSTFYGFYVLNALAQADEIDVGLDMIDRYWGGMLDLGATTFWEDFNLDWTKNASRIDELVPKGKKDIHGDFGDHCYLGFRHSFCHGWAGGPTAWLSRNVLGVEPIAPGCRSVLIEPKLGRLSWAKGSFPTPLGSINVEHRRKPDGTVKTEYHAPEGIEVVLSAQEK
jgi:alpha-L-rhamnosidase